MQHKIKNIEDSVALTMWTTLYESLNINAVQLVDFPIT